MQAVDNEIETIHLYVVREEEKRPYTAVPLFFAFLCLVGIVVITIYSGEHPYYEHETLRVPAIFLPMQTFTATQKIIPTGVKTIPATNAYGSLVIYNGSILYQQIDKGMILIASNRIEVVTDASVVVPAGNPPYYGIASVSAHVVTAGSQGNISSYAINEVYGTSLYIRNLTSFHGGKDSYSIPLQLPQDRQTAIDAARAILTTQEAQIHAILASPCREIIHIAGVRNMVVTWDCQFALYPNVPGMKVTHLKLVGKSLFVDVVFIPRPHIIVFK